LRCADVITKILMNFNSVDIEKGAVVHPEPVVIIAQKIKAAKVKYFIAIYLPRVT
jgi:hypothetical protein